MTKRRDHGYIQTRKQTPIRSRMERGSALVEFGLCMPIMLALLLGAVEYGRMAFAAIEVSNAAKAGVQYGVQSTDTAADPTGIQNAAANDAPDITLGTTTSSYSCVCSDGNASSCQPTDCPGAHIETILTVNTQATFNSVIRVPGLSNSITLHGRAVEKVIQ